MTAIAVQRNGVGVIEGKDITESQVNLKADVVVAGSGAVENT